MIMFIITCCWHASVIYAYFGGALYICACTTWTLIQCDVKIFCKALTHRGLVVQIHVSKLGQHWFIPWPAPCLTPNHYLSRSALLSTVPSGTNFRGNSSNMQQCVFIKTYLKMISKWWSVCREFNVLCVLCGISTQYDWRWIMWYIIPLNRDWIHHVSDMSKQNATMYHNYGVCVLG